MLTEEKRELFTNYYQKNPEYYIDQMESFAEKGKYSFSVPAFFLGVLWMAYRKMYLHVLIIVGLIITETFIEEMLLNLNVISSSTYEIIDKLSMLTWGLVIGYLSNRFYIRKSEKTIEKILNENTNTEQINELVSKKGGVNWFAPLVLLSLIGLVLILSLQ